jgi:hypothetical protein
MKLKYIIVVLILLLSINNVSAALVTIDKYYGTDGVGYWEVYNDYGRTQIKYFYSTCDTPLYFKHYMTTYDYSNHNYKKVYYFAPNQNLFINSDPWGGGVTFSNTVVNPSTTSQGICTYSYTVDLGRSKTAMYISNAIINDVTISGNFSCITSVDFFIKDGDGDYILKGVDSSSPYSFDTLTGFTYKLVFSDGHEYEFLCGGNEIYNYDACSYITLNFRDNCGNLIPDTEFQYCNHGTTIVCYLVNTASGSYMDI